MITVYKSTCQLHTHRNPEELPVSHNNIRKLVVANAYKSHFEYKLKLKVNIKSNGKIQNDLTQHIM